MKKVDKKKVKVVKLVITKPIRSIPSITDRTWTGLVYPTGPAWTGD